MSSSTLEVFMRLSELSDVTSKAFWERRLMSVARWRSMSVCLASWAEMCFSLRTLLRRTLSVVWSCEANEEVMSKDRVRISGIMVRFFCFFVFFINSPAGVLDAGFGAERSGNLFLVFEKLINEAFFKSVLLFIGDICQN